MRRVAQYGHPARNSREENAMRTMHESYAPRDELELTLADGNRLVLGAVVEGGWKYLIHIFSAKLPDGSFAAFDVRQVPQLTDAFAGVSIAPRARLEALAMAVHHAFRVREDFYVALVGVADKMASQTGFSLD
jgi:hypothetical protein